MFSVDKEKKKRKSHSFFVVVCLQLGDGDEPYESQYPALGDMLGMCAVEQPFFFLRINAFSCVYCAFKLAKFRAEAPRFYV